MVHAGALGLGVRVRVHADALPQLHLWLPRHLHPAQVVHAARQLSKRLCTKPPDYAHQHVPPLWPQPRAGAGPVRRQGLWQLL